jgi:hypothetical protein
MQAVLLYAELLWQRYELRVDGHQLVVKGLRPSDALDAQIRAHKPALLEMLSWACVDCSKPLPRGWQRCPDCRDALYSAHLTARRTDLQVARAAA